jgi:hypothetical protein
MFDKFISRLFYGLIDRIRSEDCRRRATLLVLLHRAGGDNPRISVRINQKMTADAKLLAGERFVSLEQHFA